MPRKKNIIGCFEVISNSFNPMLGSNLIRCKCIRCKSICNFNIDDEVLLLYEGCKHCGYNIDSNEYVDKIKDEGMIDNSDYNKLRDIWSRLKKEHKDDGLMYGDWVQSYGLFRVWAEKSGYRPWKVLDRYDISGMYNPDNCYWRLDSKRVYADREELEKYNSYGVNVKYMKSVSYSINRILIELSSLRSDCEVLLGSKFVENKGNIMDTIEDLGEAIKYIQRCEREMNNIQLIRASNHKQRKEYIVRGDDND